MQFSNEDLEQMMAEVNEAQVRISKASAHMTELSATVESNDRLLSATVDSQGVISELKLSGQSWREMPGKELAAKIIETVTQAQKEVRLSSAALFADVSPEGIDPTTGLPDGVDMETMMQGIIARFGSVSDE